MKDEWKLEISESLNSIKLHGILVMVNTKGDKLFVKPISHKNGFIELFPLTIKELKELGIEIQESCMNYDFDITVEESENLPSGEDLARKFEEDKKKHLNVKLDSPENAQKAIEIATKAKEILERKTPNPEELKEENEDLRGKLELIASRELESRMNLLNLSEDTKKAIRENPERLKGFMLAKDYYGIQSNSGTPSGSAPLNDRQLGASAQKGFENEKQMIEYLYANKTPENEAILRKLWSKFAEGIKSRGSTELPFPNIQPEPSDSTVKAIEVSVSKPQDPNEESELKKFGVGKKKKVE